MWIFLMRYFSGNQRKPVNVRVSSLVPKLLFGNEQWHFISAYRAQLMTLEYSKTSDTMTCTHHVRIREEQILQVTDGSRVVSFRVSYIDMGWLCRFTQAEIVVSWISTRWITSELNGVRHGVTYICGRLINFDCTLAELNFAVH